MARRHTDPDAEFDATACAQKLLQGPSQPSPATRSAWSPPEPAPRRTRRSSGRVYGPDSIAGICDYFARSCPPLSWAGTLEIGNRQALMQVFSELRHSIGLSPQDCRALIDLYITRLGDRRPAKPYVWDFKWRRFELLKAMRATGVGVSDADYDSWRQTAATTASDDAAFAASWETL